MINAFRTIEMLGGNVNSGNLAWGNLGSYALQRPWACCRHPCGRFFNYFVGRVNQITFSLETATVEFLGYVKPAEKPFVHSADKEKNVKRVFSQGSNFFGSNDQAFDDR